jgi:hypothetical protein
LGIINYKQIGFLLRTHHDVFVYDTIKNLKNEHFSLKSQFKYVF